jgi:type VI secretion system protein ImpH
MDAQQLNERRRRLYDALAQAPWAHDFHAVLRLVDALSDGAPRTGTALRPSAEALRLGQDPELDFAPAAVMSFGGARPRLGVRFMGLFGPMGPLPLHLTEYARDRLRNHGDATLARFADVFHHRMLSLFHRAWAQAQPAVQADRPDDDRYAAWVGALFGLAPHTLRGADTVPDAARRFVAGHLARPTRNPESIAKVLRQYFDVPIRVEPYVGHWMLLRPQDRSRLGSPLARRSCALGETAVAGARVWDRQYKLRLHVGPLTHAQYRRFLPGQRALLELRDWMRHLLGFQMQWDLRLSLQQGEVPALVAGGASASAAHTLAPVRPALGHDTWLGRPAATVPPAARSDLLLQPDRLGTHAPRRAPGHHQGAPHG